MNTIQLKRTSLSLGLCSLLTCLPVSLALAADATGLWFGTAEVNRINQVHGELTEGEGDEKVIMTECTPYPEDSGEPCDPVAMPQPIPHPFHLQMLLHVDANGAIQLLREAYVMQTKEDATNPLTRVIITDEAQLNNYDGIIRRNGKLFAARLSSTSFPIGGAQASQAVSGSIADAATLSFSVTQEKDHPTNPFRHQYHPMHGEGVDITRTVTINFQAADSSETTDPNVGLTEFHGEYLETLQGLHKSDLKVAGNIILRQVNSIGVLNAVEAATTAGE